MLYMKPFFSRYLGGKVQWSCSFPWVKGKVCIFLGLPKPSTWVSIAIFHAATHWAQFGIQVPSGRAKRCVLQCSKAIMHPCCFKNFKKWVGKAASKENMHGASGHLPLRQGLTGKKWRKKTFFWISPLFQDSFGFGGTVR